jgi:hypothetical protein
MQSPLLRSWTANSASTTTSPATQIQDRLHEQLPPGARRRTPPPTAGTADQLSVALASPPTTSTILDYAQAKSYF